MLCAHPGKSAAPAGGCGFPHKPPHPICTQVSRPDSLEHTAMGHKVLSLRSGHMVQSQSEVMAGLRKLAVTQD